MAGMAQTDTSASNEDIAGAQISASSATIYVVAYESGSMLGILYTFWGMGFLIFMQKGTFFLSRVMWAKEFKVVGQYDTVAGASTARTAWWSQ